MTLKPQALQARRAQQAEPEPMSEPAPGKAEKESQQRSGRADPEQVDRKQAGNAKNKPYNIISEVSGLFNLIIQGKVSVKTNTDLR